MQEVLGFREKQRCAMDIVYEELEFSDQRRQIKALRAHSEKIKTLETFPDSK